MEGIHRGIRNNLKLIGKEGGQIQENPHELDLIYYCMIIKNATYSTTP